MIVLPSRGRPDSLLEFFAVSRPVERGVVLIEADQYDAYKSIPLPKNWHSVIGTHRQGYVALLNRALALFPDEPWYAYMGDDVRCRPEGWDTALAHSAGRDAIAYGDDGINGERTCGLPFIGGDLVRRIGWLGYPKLQHLYCDTIWYEIGKALGLLRYHPEIVTEHLHWSTGKMAKDQTANERQTAGDREAYTDFMLNHFAEAVRPCLV